VGHQGNLYKYDWVMTRGFEIYNKIGTLTCSVTAVVIFPKINFFKFPAKYKGQVGHIVYQTTRIDETDIMVKEFLKYFIKQKSYQINKN